MSGLLLLAMAPIIVFVAIAIVADSRGPVFFRSPRVGRDGRRFDMLKFRKMRDDIAGPPLTTTEDPRYTRIGLWLTKSKLDEIPQLWNVFRGQMTLVGPRPEDPRFVDERREDYQTILQAKQGMTGLSQLAFYEEPAILDPDDPVTHYRESIWPAKIGLDRLYVSRATIWWDLRILSWSVRRWVLRCPVAVNRNSGVLTPRKRPRTMPTPATRSSAAPRSAQDLA